MPTYGYIREKNDIKFLILYAMSYLTLPVSESALLDICLIDEAFGYLEFSEAFHELTQSAHVMEEKIEKRNCCTA